jgi:hypothetical protein
MRTRGAIRTLIEEQGATPKIPAKSNRKKPCFSKRLYRERNLIERFFSNLPQLRHAGRRKPRTTAKSPRKKSLEYFRPSKPGGRKPKVLGEITRNCSRSLIARELAVLGIPVNLKALFQLTTLKGLTCRSLNLYPWATEICIIYIMAQTTSL